MNEKLLTFKLDHYRRALDIPAEMELTSALVLEEVEKVEQTIKALGPFDPATEHFIGRKLQWEELALLLIEKEQAVDQ